MLQTNKAIVTAAAALALGFHTSIASQRPTARDSLSSCGYARTVWLRTKIKRKLTYFLEPQPGSEDDRHAPGWIATIVLTTTADDVA